MALSAILALVLVASASGASYESRLDVASCGTHTMAEGGRLVLQSPNFPSPYKVDDRCQWEISCPTETDHFLEFICPTFILESSTDCTKDRLVLASRGSQSVNCGTSSPDGTTTSTGWARLTFFSNADKVQQGFRCYVWCRAIPTTPSTSTTAATTTATTSATTTVATTTAATTTAATTTAATTTAATTTAATTTAATTTAATTTAVTTTAATTTAATTTAATTTAATTTAATTPAATTPAATTTAATTTAATTLAATTIAETTTAATTTAATTTAATTIAATTVAATTIAATTIAETTTPATTIAATTIAATTIAETTAAATTIAESTTAATTTAATTTAAITTAATTTTVAFDLKECGVHELTEGQRVVIETPNFPAPYTTDDRCQWEFSCPTEADHYLEFICPKFALQSSTDCTADRLTLTSRGEQDVKCGSDSPDGTITSTGWARLTYFSNADTVAAGFRCYVWCRAK